MKLGVISDLHIGSAARAKELCPYTNDSALDDGFIAALKRLIDSRNLSCEYLLVPGDVTNTAHPIECKLAGEIIQEVASLLKVPNKNVIIVPGNHDVSWVIPNALTTALTEKLPTPKNPAALAGFTASKRYMSFAWKDGHFDTFLDGEWHQLLSDPYFVLLDRPDAVIAAYNSAFNDGPDKNPHNGEAHTEHLTKIAVELNKLKPKSSDPRPRIFIVHHHVHQHTGPNYNWVDFSIMHNADGLQKLLGDFEFDLLVHGHKHFPRFATHSISGNPPLAILGAGSFSRSLDKLEIEILGNTFHVVDTHGRNQSKSLQGEVLTWVYQQMHGWIPAEKKRYAIAHVRPFGCDWTKSHLEKRLEAEIQSALSKSNVVKMAALIQSNLSELRFSDSEMLGQALGAVASKLSLDVVNQGEDPRNWMVLKD